MENYLLGQEAGISRNKSVAYLFICYIEIWWSGRRNLWNYFGEIPTVNVRKVDANDVQYNNEFNENKIIYSVLIQTIKQLNLCLF